jgi:DNA-binding CsgD family transcriptional regulator
MAAGTDLCDLIDAIYDAGVDARRWPEVCAAGILGALRNMRSFYSEGEIDALRALLPHLRNAIRVQRHTAGPRHKRTRALRCAGCACARRAARRRRRASDLCKPRRRNVASRGERPPLEPRWPQRCLARDDARAAHVRSGGALLIERAPPDEPLHALISPLDARHRPPNARGDARGTAMLVLIDPQSSRRGVETRLVALFGLTPTEARVASEVDKGHHPRDIADTLQILPSTVRTHLHHVFAKTATRRQSELMRLMAQLAIMRGG